MLTPVLSHFGSQGHNLNKIMALVSSKIYDKRDDFNFEIFPISGWRYSSFPLLHPAPVPPPHTFRSLFVLQECAQMVVSNIEINFDC